jgi:DNA gyrase inhibitor GyrI
MSDANGNYRFDRLPGGNYHVYATQHSRYQQTAPVSVFHDVTLANGGTVSKKNFGFKRLPK